MKERKKREKDELTISKRKEGKTEKIKVEKRGMKETNKKE